MRKLALLLTITSLVLGSTACMRPATKEKETESTADVTTNETLDNEVGEPLDNIINEESMGTSEGKPINTETISMETDNGVVINIQLNDADTYEFRELYECVDVVCKDDAEKYSAVFVFGDKVEYEYYMGTLKDNTKDNIIAKMTQGVLASTISTSQSGSDEDAVNTSESKGLWDYILYSYEDTYGRTHYVYSLTSEEFDGVIAIENVTSQELSEDIFNSLWFEIQ